MSQRSPLNERYQKHTSPAGKTRKSAAAAKPKRASGAPSTTSSKSSSKSSRPRERQPMVVHPTSPEYKRMRIIWWALLIAAVVITTVSWAVRAYLPQYMQASNYILGLGYAFIFAALYIDWAKLRPMRQEWAKSGQAVAAGKMLEKDKADKAKVKAAEADAKAAAKAESKAAESSADDKS